MTPRDVMTGSSVEFRWRSSDDWDTQKNYVGMFGKLWGKLEHQSEATYSRTVEKLLYRMGQGSCSSPIVWALLNQFIMKALGEKIECITLVLVDNSKTSTRPGDSFVDDTTTGVTADNTTREPVPIEEN
jgi:hypothetical protein